MSPTNGLPSGYTLAVAGDVYAVQYRSEAILQFERLTEHRDGLTAEVTAILMLSGESHWSRLTLAAPRSRAELAKRLAESLPGPPWPSILDVSPYAVTAAFRRGTPSQPVDSTSDVEASPLWLVNGFIPLGKPTVLYGDGGKGKSLTALALGLACLRGVPLAGAAAWHPEQPLRSVLYLDYEEDHGTVTRLARALCDADGVKVPDGLRYIHMTRPLADALPQLSREVASWGVDAVIVDSWVPACGPMPETADAAQRAFAALRMLGGTSLIVAHVTKASAESGQTARPFGSVMNSNLVRSAIEVTGVRDRATLSVTLCQTKSNRGPQLPPRNLTFTFAGIDPYDPTEIAVESGEPDISRLPILDRIKRALLDAPDRTAETETLAEECGVSPEVLRVTLQRQTKTGTILKLTETKGGRGKKTQWKLADTNRNT